MISNHLRFVVVLSIIAFSYSHVCAQNDARWRQEKRYIDSLLTALKTPPTSYQMPQTRPANFAFRFETTHGNILDLFKHSLTIDLVMDPDTTIPFSLSSSELDQIFDAMRDINLFNYPRLWHDNDIHSRTFSQAKYIMRIDSLTRTTTIESVYGQSKRDTCRYIMRLNDIVWKIIKSYPSYKALPEPRGGYL
jgi:hypothetical protein